MVHNTFYTEKNLLVRSVKTGFKPVLKEQFSSLKSKHPAIAAIKKWLVWLMAI